MEFVGIDFGTDSITVSLYQDGAFKLLQTPVGRPKTSAYVSFCNDETLVGDEAKNQSGMYPFTTFFHAKRFLHELPSSKDNLPFGVEYRGPSFNTAYTDISGATSDQINVVDILALLFKQTFEACREKLQSDQISAYVTCSGSFNDIERERLRALALQAGFVQVGIVSDALAAMVGCSLYPLIHPQTRELTVLLLNLGAVFAEVSLFKLCDKKTLSTLGTYSCNDVGGFAFDQLVVQYCCKEFSKKNPGAADPWKSKAAIQRLRLQCEDAKVLISTAKNVSIKVQNFVDGLDLSLQVSRETYDNLTMHVVLKILRFLELSLIKADLEKSLVDEILLVGATSRIPAIKQHVKAFFRPDDFSPLSKDAPINEAVFGHSADVTAYGAAALALLLSSADKLEAFWQDNNAGRMKRSVYPSTNFDIESLKAGYVFTESRNDGFTVHELTAKLSKQMPSSETIHLSDVRRQSTTLGIDKQLLELHRERKEIPFSIQEMNNDYDHHERPGHRNGRNPKQCDIPIDPIPTSNMPTFLATIETFTMNKNKNFDTHETLPCGTISIVSVEGRPSFICHQDVQNGEKTSFPVNDMRASLSTKTEKDNICYLEDYQTKKGIMLSFTNEQMAAEFFQTLQHDSVEQTRQDLATSFQEKNSRRICAIS